MQTDLADDPEAELALRRNEARLLNVLMHLPDAVCVISGNRISFVNDAAKRLFDTSGPELLGRLALDVLPRGSLAADQARLAALQAVSYPVPMVEEEVMRADGTARIVETTAMLIDDRSDVAVLAIMRDITDLKKTQNNLLEAHAELQRLLSERDTVQEDERKRIARELHDDLQQSLSAIRIDLGVAAEQLATDPASASALLARVDALALTAINSTRRIVNDLRPQVLAERDLVPALGLLANQFGQRTGIDCSFEPSHAARESVHLSAATTLCLYRVAQEALNNVVKHAGASAVRIQMVDADDGRLVLRISDNGRGMDKPEGRSPGSFGLLGMRERVRAVGGALRIDSNPGSGTTVEVRVAVGGVAAATADIARVEGSAELQAPATEAAGSAPVSALLFWRADDRLGTDAASTSDARFLQGVIDALGAQTAVLDSDGRIRLVNQAWRAFAEQNGDPGMRASGPGVNYLEVCRRSAATDRSALQVLQGLAGILEGTRAVFVSEYPCDAPHESRWFRLHAAPIVGGGALVTHFNLNGNRRPDSQRIER